MITTRNEKKTFGKFLNMTVKQIRQQAKDRANQLKAKRNEPPKPR